MAASLTSKARPGEGPPSTSGFRCNRRKKELSRVSENRKPVIVLVDDEPMILTSIRTLLTLEMESDVESFTSPSEAVKYLEKNTVDLTISDYMMPGMTGIQLLAEAKRLQPEATRVLLTGHADKASAIQAINEVGLFQYLEKPWDNAQLLLVIQQGIERTGLLRELRQKIAELDTAHSTLKNSQARLLKAFLESRLRLTPHEAVGADARWRRAHLLQNAELVDAIPGFHDLSALNTG